MAELGRGCEPAAQGEPIREGKYLTFVLGLEEYGIGIRKVKEIIGMLPITPVPRTPEHLKGVINLRGKVIPVVDLRVKFGMKEKEYSERTCIIVVEVRGSSGPVLMGIVVDAVSEVLNIRKSDIEDPPTFRGKGDPGYILGLAKTGKTLKILLDIDRVFPHEGNSLLEKDGPSREGPALPG